MTKYSKFNIIYRLQKWMDSVPGQTFLNYAYSWGAAVVILGTLFKLTHLPGANFWLFLGMGTEVVVFFLSAFDRPFDKTADGRELPTHLGVGADGEGEGVVADVQEGLHVSTGPFVSGGVQGGGPIIIGGGGSGGGSGYAEGGLSTGTSGDDDLQVAAVAQPVGGGGGTTTWVAQQQETTPEMIEAQGNYVDNLNKLDEINEQTRKLAKQIAELNKIYARMIEAMTVNMPKAPMPTVNNEDL